MLGGTWERLVTVGVNRLGPGRVGTNDVPTRRGAGGGRVGTLSVPTRNDVRTGWYDA